MLKSLMICGLTASLSFVAGCATTTSGLGEEAGSTRLPSGLALLESDEESCGGTVQVAEETLEDEGEGLRGEFFVEPGENAAFELEEGYEEVEWACVESGASDVEEIRCPSGTTHVRFTRDSTGGEMLVECYGNDVG